MQVNGRRHQRQPCKRRGEIRAQSLAHQRGVDLLLYPNDVGNQGVRVEILRGL
jgi:hypothetical protein